MWARRSIAERLTTEPKPYEVEPLKRLLKMPANTWGSTILSTLMFKTPLCGQCFSADFLLIGGLQIFGLVCSGTAQTVLLRFLSDLADSRHTDPAELECNPQHTRATWVCCLLLSAHVVANEFRESLEMMHFINQIPLYRPEKHKETRQKSDMPVVVIINCEDKEKGGVGKPATGIGITHTLVVYILIAWKVQLATWLAISSFDFIMYTEDLHEILLNCTATLFICEIDDICYKLVNPSTLQQLFQNYPAFEEPKWQERWMAYWRCLKSVCCKKHDEQTKKPDAQAKNQDEKEILGTALSAAFAPVCTFLSALSLHRFFCRPDFVLPSQDSTNWTAHAAAGWAFWVFGTWVLTLSFGCGAVAVRLIWQNCLRCDPPKFGNSFWQKCVAADPIDRE